VVYGPCLAHNELSSALQRRTEKLLSDIQLCENEKEIIISIAFWGAYLAHKNSEACLVD